MKELRASRVVVIDDDAKEGDGLRRALAKGGIPSLVFAGLEDLPTDRLTGVRLAALDADLTSIFADTTDYDRITDPTASMLANLLAKENGPYHALIWTKHTELADSLVARLKHRQVPPAASTILAKEDVRSGEDWNIQKILGRIQQSQREHPCVSFLSEWEGAVFDAGVATVSNLFRDDTCTKVLSALAYTERPEATAEERLRAVTESLSRLHADALDSRSEEYSDEVVAQLFGVDIPKPSEGLRARLHGRLLLSTAEVGASPGSIYTLADIARRLQKPKWFPDEERIRQDLGGEAGVIANTQATPVAVEVTPLCDKSREDRIARFLVGLAIRGLSKTKRNGLRNLKSQAFKHLGPLAIPDFGNIDFVWCTRLAFTAPIDRVRTLLPIGRFRYDVLVDLQSWSAAQASRPGHLFISP